MSTGIPAHPVIGIIGGMGPQATVDLMRRVIAATPASDDADHIHLIVDCNPKVPSRIAALIEGTGPDPAPELVRMAKGLEAAGATVLAIPCNTAHAYIGEIAAAVSIPVLDMVKLTAERVAHMILRNRRVGMLASTAVKLVGLYDKALQPLGISLVWPKRQADLMGVIKAVKRGDRSPANRNSFATITADLMARDTDMLLIACTELSMLADSLDRAAPVLDAVDVLSEEIVGCGLRGKA
jgi:aspartate racemase